MSYLFPEGSGTDLGVLQVGGNINVANSIISIPQNIATNSTVTFDTINTSTALKLDGKSAITTVTPSAGSGISVTSLTSTGPSSVFTINNTGVTGLVAGNNISISSSTGNVTITATGLGVEQTYGANSNYTATTSDEYIGGTVSGITITLPAGVNGKTYTVKNEGAGNNITVSGTSGEKLDGSSSKALSNNASLTAIFRAGSWRII